jgi:hypothetical protein
MAEKIKYLTIEGKQYPLWGGFYALEKFELTTGLSSEHVTSTVTNSVVFTWCSMWAGAKMEENDLEMTLDKFKAEVNKDMSILLRAKGTEEEDVKNSKRVKDQSPPED